MIEILQEKDQYRTKVAVDGNVLSQTSAYFYATEGKWSVSIYGKEGAELVLAQRFSDVPKNIASLSLTLSHAALQHTGLRYRLQIGYSETDELAVAIVCSFYISNWKHLWSIQEYMDEFALTIQRMPQFRAAYEQRRGAINPSFLIKLPLEDVESAIEAEVLKHIPIIRDWHELTEASLLSRLQTPNVEQIIRSIEFPPEYYHSGITILSYFTDVLRNKNLSEQVKVSIEQAGLHVRLVIESPTGQRELIERTLETYALVVTGKQPIDTLTTDPYEITELKNQLRIASVQIENQRDMLALKSSEVQDTKASLNRLEKRADEDRARLMSLIEGLIKHNSDLSSGFRELAEKAIKFQNKKLANALESLHEMVERGVQGEDQDEAIKNLTIIQQEDAGVFRQVAEMVKDAISGAAGSYLYSWIQTLVYSLPK